MEKEATLLSGDIKKTYVSYLIPTIVGMLTNSVYCIVDVMFVGLCIGAQGLAAFNIAMPVYTIYSSLGLMLGVGGAVTISDLMEELRTVYADRFVQRADRHWDERLWFAFPGCLRADARCQSAADAGSEGLFTAAALRRADLYS